MYVKALLLLLAVGCATAPKNGPEDGLDRDERSFQVEGSQFIIIGDTGTGEDGQYKVAKGMENFCALNACQFGLLLGDNFYPAGVENPEDTGFEYKFERPYQRLTFPFFPVLGNHDHDGNWQAQTVYESQRWYMPGRYYHLEATNADFYAIDTQIFDEEQRAWLDASLARSRRPKIIYGHHPAYSSGMHGDEAVIKKYLVPLMKKHGVIFYFAGHDHDLEVIEKDGGVFLISGAGSKIRDIKGGKDTVFAKSALGFAHMDTSKRPFRLRLLDEKGQVLFDKPYNP